MTPDAYALTLRRYRWYVMGISFYAWMPIFFLYFSQRVSFEQVLQLEAIYYLVVVIGEVPSGYASDRLGRRATLLLASGALCVSYLLFASSTQFVSLAIAQGTLAMALALNSGTDTSFHFETLRAAGQVQSYEEREAKLATVTLITGACAALLGGALAQADMRLSYLCAACAAGVAHVAMWGCRSIEMMEQEEASLRGFFGSWWECVALSARPGLRVFYLVCVVSVVLNHIPYEFYQPYLKRVMVGDFNTLTPLMAGLHMMVAQLLGAWAATYSVALAHRLGIHVHLIISCVLQLALIVGMWVWVHPVMAVLLCARGVPGALQRAPLLAHIMPQLPSPSRATYLSWQSLSGRLAFSAVLWGISMSSLSLDF